MSSSTRSPTRCAPPLALERALVGEIQDSASAVWMEHLESCERCQQALNAMRAEAVRYEQSSEAQVLARQLERPMRSPAGRQWPWYAALAAITTAGAALWLGVRDRGPTPDSQRSVWQSKGGPLLAATVVRRGVVASWQGQPLKQGDVLQLEWTSGEAGYLALWVRDDKGQVERVFPENGVRSQEVPAGSEVPIGPGLVVRGDTLDSTLWGAFGERPFDLAGLEQQLDKSGLLQAQGAVTDVVKLDLDIEAPNP